MPRLVTSVMSGAVTWTTSVPARPDDGQLCDLGDHCVSVGAGFEYGQRPVYLEPELSHRPDRVVLLHLGDGDPRGFAIRRVVEHRRCTRGARGGEPGHLLVHADRSLHFPLCRLCLPGGQPLRLGGPAVPACPATVRRASALVRRVFCAACCPSSRSSAWTATSRARPCTGRSEPSVPGVSARDRELNRSITSWLTRRPRRRCRPLAAP